MHSLSAGSGDLTEETLDVDLEVELCIRLHDNPRYDESVLVPGSDGFHEASCAERLFILQVSQLRHVDVGRAGRERGEREALAHDDGW